GRIAHRLRPSGKDRDNARRIVSVVGEGPVPSRGPKDHNRGRPHPVIGLRPMGGHGSLPSTNRRAAPREEEDDMRTTRRRFLQASALGAAGAMGMGRGRLGVAPAAAQSGTLTVWGFEGTLDGLKSQTDAFKQKYPDVKVDVKEFGYNDVHTNLL